MTLTGRAGVAILAVALATSGLAGAGVSTSRQVAPATGIVAGQVIDAATGRGVGDTVVTLTPQAAPGAPIQSPVARDASSRKVITDEEGRFAFGAVVRGRYSITSTKPGYVPGAAGKLVPRGASPPVDIGDAQRLIDVRIRMWKHAVVAGTLTDEAGEPVVGAEVRIYRRSAVNGRAGFSDAAVSTTDDRGVYRFRGLEPGSYAVGVPSVSTTLPVELTDAYEKSSGPARAEMQQALFAAAPTLAGPVDNSHVRLGPYLLQVQGRMVPPPPDAGDGATLVYGASFYPATDSLESADVLTLSSGEVREGIDLRLRPSATARISGTVAGPDGPIGIVALHLVRATSATAGTLTSQPAATTVADASGRFTFLGVLPGQYVLRALKLPRTDPAGAQVMVIQTPDGPVTRGIAGGQPAPSAQPTWWASQAVTVSDRDAADLRVSLQSGFRVSGSIVIHGGGTLPMPIQRLAPYLETADAGWSAQVPELVVDADATFSSVQVPPGRYRLTVPLPAGWHVKSATAGTRDLAELPFDLDADVPGVVVTISTRGARISGVVRTGDGVDGGASVFAFPVDPRQWTDYGAYPRRIREARSTSTGTYTLSDLPAGEYFVVAVQQADVDWSRPGFLEALSRTARRLTLTEGQAGAMDLRTGPVKW